MKKFILTTLILFAGFLFTNLQAQITVPVTIKGEVTDVVTGAPIANQNVYITTDSVSSLFFYYNIVSTDNAGHYLDVVDVPANMQILFNIFTFDCYGNMHSAFGMSTNSPIINNFSICGMGTSSCQADFHVVPDSLTQFAYHFIDLSTPIPDIWTWDFGDGTTSGLQNPYHAYNFPGVYQVCLTITSGSPGTTNFCQDTYCKDIIVDTLPGQCHNHFQYAVNNLTVDFFGYAIPASSSFIWDFGDGSTGMGQNVNHTYAAPGIYSVILVTSDFLTGCSFTSVNMVHVTGMNPCLPMFFASPLPVNNMTFEFFDMSSGTPVSWFWDFGDGATSTVQNPVHSYNSPGLYTVCLTIACNANGITATFCDSLFVNGNPGNCDALFFYHPDSTYSFGYYFMDASTPLPDTWLWDFGDGTTSNIQNPFHVFNAHGAYNVCLTITKGAPGTSTFCQDTYCEMVFVDTLPGQCFNNFQYAVNNFTVDFFGMAIPPNSVYTWDFGDGSTGTGQNVSHTYATPGMYQVSLTTFLLGGCSYTSTQMVHVTGQNVCDPMFLALPQSIPNLTIDFIDVSNGNPISWYWEFGDGTTSTIQHPSHTYNAPGLYTVCLTIVCNPNTPPATYCDSVFVNGSGPNCNAMFYHHPDSTYSFGYYFMDASTPTPDTWLWEFGDGTTSNIQNPFHVFNAPGVYNVCLTITKGTPGTTNFCQDTYCNNIFVDTIPALCHNNFQYAINNLTVNFYGIAVPVNSVYQWDFGDGSNGTGQNVVHTYAGPGMYPVTLVTTDFQTGCSFTSTKMVNVTGVGVCDPMFHMVPDSNTNMTFHFIDLSSGPPTSWYWDFGDGTHSIMQNPIHTYITSGVYNVCLTIICDPILPAVTHCKTLNVNSGPTGGKIYGSITMGFGFADHAKVFLIVFDPVTNTLTAVDTVLTQGNGGVMGYYEFQNVQPGTYLVKAALTPNSVSYADFMPTYFINTLWWDYATNVIVNNQWVMVDINLIAGSNPGGPGFIGGNVTQGANKLLGPGDAVPDVEIMLLSMNDDPHLYTYSDANGDYGFSNLAYGTYKIWAEVFGKTTIPAIVTINANNPSITNINLIVNSTNITTSVDDNVSAFVEYVSDVYPNPVNDEMTVEVSFKLPSELQLDVFNQIGQMVYSKSVNESAGQQVIKINTSGLDGGVYSLRITTKDNAQIMRKFVKIN